MVSLASLVHDGDKVLDQNEWWVLGGVCLLGLCVRWWPMRKPCHYA